MPWIVERADEIGWDRLEALMGEAVAAARFKKAIKKIGGVGAHTLSEIIAKFGAEMAVKAINQ